MRSPGRGDRDDVAAPVGRVGGALDHLAGGPQATGSGTSEYVGPGQSVATGTAQPVTVVAFKLGNCHGIRMYKAVEWYFPQHGQAFDAGRYENVCAGRYVPGP